MAVVETMAEAHDWRVRVTDSTLGGARFEFVGVDVPARPAGISDAVVGRATDD